MTDQQEAHLRVRRPEDRQGPDRAEDRRGPADVLPEEEASAEKGSAATVQSLILI